MSRVEPSERPFLQQIRQQDAVYSQPVDRPWWAISNVAKNAWIALTITCAAAAIALSVTAFYISSAAIGAAAIATAIGLSTLLGIGVFEKLRAAHLLPGILQKPADVIHVIATEVFCLIGSSLFYVTALVDTNPHGRAELGQKPILLVHGYLHNSSAWVYLRARLKHAGLGPIYTINLGSPFTFGNIEEYAQHVSRKVNDILAETGCDKVICVGHSMGGIVSSHAATSHDPENHIEEVITLGSPLKGTHIARLGLGHCARQMRHGPENEFLVNFNETVEKVDVHGKRIHNMRSNSDEIVIPNASAELENAASVAVFPLYGHLRYLWSDDVADRIINIVRGGDAQQEIEV